MSRKDLLRASLNTNIDGTPVAVCMTRVPHVKTCTPEFTILEAADTLQKYEVDSLPVVEKENPKKLLENYENENFNLYYATSERSRTKQIRELNYEKRDHCLYYFRFTWRNITKLLAAASAQYPDISFLNRYNFSLSQQKKNY